LFGRILVVDDEEDIRVLTGRGLVREGYDVDLAGNGDEAWEWLRDYDYALVILDVMMPNKNGLEVIQDMKKTERLQNVSIIVFSALGSGLRTMVEEGHRADEYIEKPFTRKELMMKIGKLVKYGK
jgi:two-component system response regulator ResD